MTILTANGAWPAQRQRPSRCDRLARSVSPRVARNWLVPLRTVRGVLLEMARLGRDRATTGGDWHWLLQCLRGAPSELNDNGGVLPASAGSWDDQAASDGTAFTRRTSLPGLLLRAVRIMARRASSGLAIPVAPGQDWKAPGSSRSLAPRRFAHAISAAKPIAAKPAHRSLLPAAQHRPGASLADDWYLDPDGRCTYSPASLSADDLATMVRERSSSIALASGIRLGHDRRGSDICSIAMLRRPEW